MVKITAIGRVNSGDHIVFLLTKMSTRITMITYDHNMVMMVIVNHDIDVCINITYSNISSKDDRALPSKRLLHWVAV